MTYLNMRVVFVNCQYDVHEYTSDSEIPLFLLLLSQLAAQPKMSLICRLDLHAAHSTPSSVCRADLEFFLHTCLLEESLQSLSYKMIWLTVNQSVITSILFKYQTDSQ